MVNYQISFSYCCYWGFYIYIYIYIYIHIGLHIGFRIRSLKFEVWIKGLMKCRLMG